ncbi:hypothetical protein KIV45_21020 [Janthinobacterium lividum]|nr:hypothetical protein KIV45_21020 [Janthinobacterium lividum]
MKNRLLTMNLLLGDLHAINGLDFIVCGVLIAGESSYMEISENERIFKIIIEDSTLIDRLLDEVPCYMGGEDLYRDAAKIMATISVKENSVVVISKVSSGVLTRDDDNFSF